MKIDLDIWMRCPDDLRYIHITGTDKNYIYVDNHCGPPAYKIWRGDCYMTHSDAQRDYLDQGGEFCESPLKTLDIHGELG